MIDIVHSDISIQRQCDLIDLSRSSYYYTENLNGHQSPENFFYMSLIDQKYLERPFYGSRRITHYLHNLGYQVNRKRIRRLMQIMGIQAIYPRPKTSIRGKDHKIYPYLLRGLIIDRVDQVWAADITFIPMAYGFMYLVAIIDWFSRYVLSWELSNTLDSDFCVTALIGALKYGIPDIFNSDQGSQFTSHDFTDQLLTAGIQISMDGRGRVMDNIFIERLWRSLKYEDIYIKEYETVKQLYQGLEQYFDFYNYERPHQSLGYKTPSMVYFGIDNVQKMRDNIAKEKSYSHIHKKKEKKQKKEKLLQLHYTLN
jgi:putative transposase